MSELSKVTKGGGGAIIPTDNAQFVNTTTSGSGISATASYQITSGKRYYIYVHTYDTGYYGKWTSLYYVSAGGELTRIKYDFLKSNNKTPYAEVSISGNTLTMSFSSNGSIYPLALVIPIDE